MDHTAQDLVSIIQNHNMAAFVRADGRIEATEVYAYDESEQVTLEPTLAAVKAWLGY